MALLLHSPLLEAGAGVEGEAASASASQRQGSRKGSSQQQHKERQGELWIANPSQSWENSRQNYRRSPLHPKTSSKESFCWSYSPPPSLRDVPTLHHYDDDDDDILTPHDNDGDITSPTAQQPKGGLTSPLRPCGRSLYQDELLLQTLCDEGHLERALDALSHMDTSLSTNTYLSLLKQCNKKKSLIHAKQVHTHLARHHRELTGFLGDYLVVTLAKCGAIEAARQISTRLACRTVFSWTAMISAYVECGREQEALKLHQFMKEEGVEPDSFTFVSLFKACGNIADLGQGKILHKDARRKGLTSDIFVGNTLVSMYGKCGAVVEAEDVFVSLSHRDIVSWTAMLSAYVEQGQGEKALQLYRQMQEEGMSPNRLTCVIALQACVTVAEKEEALVVEGRSTKVMSLEIGQALHAYARAKDIVSDAFVGTTLLNMYGKCGTIGKAEDVFSVLSQQNIVSWNAMISGCVDQSHEERALLMYRHMQEEGVTPDLLTFVVALQACAALAKKEAPLVVDGRSIKFISLKIGQALHADACMNDFVSDAFVGTTLVNMYGKCGTITEAEDVFSALSQVDIVSWTAMFSAYVEQGQGEKALELYRQMQKQHVTLDDVTLMLSWTAMLSGLVEQGQGEKALQLYWQMQKQGVMLDDVALNCVLQACSLTGSLEICKQIHFGIICAGYDWMHSVAATLIHAYGSSASMVDAQVIFDKLSEPDIVSWTACIAGHAGEGDSTACLGMFEKLKRAGMMPDEVTFSSVLSACCHAGLVPKGLEYFESMSRDYDVTPDLKHYGIMLDLLGRAGDFIRIENMLGSMPMQADLAIWLCLLGACRTHGNVELAKNAFDLAVNLQPKQAAAYVLMSNIYADAGLQECAAEVEISRQKAGAWWDPGHSSVEHENEVYSFFAGDHKHPQGKYLYHFLLRD